MNSMYTQSPVYVRLYVCMCHAKCYEKDFNALDTKDTIDLNKATTTSQAFQTHTQSTSIEYIEQLVDFNSFVDFVEMRK